MLLSVWRRELNSVAVTVGTIVTRIYIPWDILLVPENLKIKYSNNSLH